MTFDFRLRTFDVGRRVSEVGLLLPQRGDGVEPRGAPREEGAEEDAGAEGKEGDEEHFGNGDAPRKFVEAVDGGGKDVEAKRPQKFDEGGEVVEDEEGEADAKEDADDALDKTVQNEGEANLAGGKTKGFEEADFAGLLDGDDNEGDGDAEDGDNGEEAEQEGHHGFFHVNGGE